MTTKQRGYKTVKKVYLFQAKKRSLFTSYKQQIKMHLRKIDHLEANNKDLSVELANQRMESQQLLSRVLSLNEELMSRHELIVSMKNQMKKHEADFASIRCVFQDSFGMMSRLVDTLNAGMERCSDGQRRSRSIHAALLCALDNHACFSASPASRDRTEQDTVAGAGSDGRASHVPLRAARCVVTAHDDEDDEDENETESHCHTTDSQHTDSQPQPGGQSSCLLSTDEQCSHEEEGRLSVIDERSETGEFSRLSTSITSAINAACSVDMPATVSSDHNTSGSQPAITVSSATNHDVTHNDVTAQLESRVSAESVVCSPVLIRKQQRLPTPALDDNLMVESSVLAGDERDDRVPEDEDAVQQLDAVMVERGDEGRVSRVVGCGVGRKRRRRTVHWQEGASLSVCPVSSSLSSDISQQAGVSTTASQSVTDLTASVSARAVSRADMSDSLEESCLSPVLSANKHATAATVVRQLDVVSSGRGRCEEGKCGVSVDGVVETRAAVRRTSRRASKLTVSQTDKRSSTAPDLCASSHRLSSTTHRRGAVNSRDSSPEHAVVEETGIMAGECSEIHNREEPGNCCDSRTQPDPAPVKGRRKRNSRTAAGCVIRAVSRSRDTTPDHVTSENSAPECCSPARRPRSHRAPVSYKELALNRKLRR